MVEDKTNLIIETINPLESDTRALRPSDINIHKIKMIAAASLLNGPDVNSDVGHAFKRRYGVKEMLGYLATIDHETNLSLEYSTVSLLFPHPNTEPLNASAK